ncbi:MAG: metal-dependent transcriptional regulator [Anaerolineales bacterium]|nr:metal-dependent transcriptional regulator [Anaerolineales bacterium]
MGEPLSGAAEDYLKVIYDLTCEEERASTTGIAARMKLKPASVTGMLKRLAACDPPLVEYHRHRGVRLTPAGRRVALEVIRHHRLLEQYLHERLGYGWDEVHAEADRLEHVISEKLAGRIARELGEPARDPHGEPIPTRELQVPPETGTRLSEMRAGQSGMVIQVNDTSPEFLRYLDTIGLTPRVRVRVAAYSPFDGNLTIEVEGRGEEIILGPRVTEQVLIDFI